MFEPDGSIIGIGRRREPAQLLRSNPPYTVWQRKSLSRTIGGPLIARWAEHTLVGGRHTTKQGPVTSLCWLVDDELEEFAVLPSGGDTSYPGFIALSPTHGVVSWYSSHEKNEQGRNITAIYMADLKLVGSGEPQP